MSRISTSQSAPSFSNILGIIIALLSIVGLCAAGYEIVINNVTGEEFKTNCFCLVFFLVLFFLGMFVQLKSDS